MLDDEHGGVEMAADFHDEGSEGLGFSLRYPGGGLIQAQHLGVEGEESGEFDDSAGAGGEVGDLAVG